MAILAISDFRGFYGLRPGSVAFRCFVVTLAMLFLMPATLDRRATGSGLVAPRVKPRVWSEYLAGAAEAGLVGDR